MPSKSRAQHNLMEMVAHDPRAAKRTGISQSVAKDFVAADKADRSYRKRGHVGAAPPSRAANRKR